MQRIVAHESVLDELRERLVERSQALQVGDPLSDSTGLGPLVDEVCCAAARSNYC